MKTIKKIIHLVLTILVLLLLPAVVFTLLTSKTDKIYGIQSFVVLTGSMEPEIAQGSILYTFKASQFKTREIIAFEQNGVTVTHRIVGRKLQNGDYIYKTKGDANNTLDQGFVEQKQVLGKSIFSVPYVGKLVHFLKTIEGFVAVIIFPIVVFVVFEIWNLKKEIEKSVERKLLQKIESV